MAYMPYMFLSVLYVCPQDGEQASSASPTQDADDAISEGEPHTCTHTYIHRQDREHSWVHCIG